MSKRLSENIKLGEVSLSVSNLERSLHFYQKVIGLSILERGNNHVRLTANGMASLLYLVEIPEAVVPLPNTRAGLYHFALLLPTRKDLGLVVKHFFETGIRFGQADHLVSEALYLSDPDGNGIEIYRDLPKDSWSYDGNGEVVMASNPVAIQEIVSEVGNEDFTGLPQGTVMGHVHLQVNSLDSAEQFYVNMLGFDVAVSSWKRHGALFLATGGYHHHIGLNVWGGEDIGNRTELETGLNYFTIEFADSSELIRVVERLKMKGSIVEEREKGWFVKDLFGIEVRLV